MLMILAMVAGCATRPASTPTSAGPIIPAKAKLTAEQVVWQMEDWRRVDSDAREVDRGWKVFVVRRPYSAHDPMVNVTLDQRGQVLEYDKFRNYE